VVSPQVDEWAASNREFLDQYGPRVGRDDKGNETVERNYVRTVYRVFVAGGVNVSLISNASTGARVDAGASKSIALFDAGPSTDAASAAQNYAQVLSSLSQSIASATPGANLTLASASSRSVAMNETFPRPLVIGYLAFDRAIEEGGILGPPLPTQARVTGRRVNEAVAAFATDANTAKIREWLNRDPANRIKLREWVAANADGVGIALFLNSNEHRQNRARAIQALDIQ
jgi:hypothetical protein